MSDPYHMMLVRLLPASIRSLSLAECYVVFRALVPALMQLASAASDMSPSLERVDVSSLDDGELKPGEVEEVRAALGNAASGSGSGRYLLESTLRQKDGRKDFIDLCNSFQSPPERVVL